MGFGSGNGFEALQCAADALLRGGRDCEAQLGSALGIVAPERTRADRLPDVLLANAVRRGLVTPAALPPGPPPETPGVAPLDTILGELESDRADR